jgi:hypothetical protein
MRGRDHVRVIERRMSSVPISASPASIGINTSIVGDLYNELLILLVVIYFKYLIFLQI